MPRRRMIDPIFWDDRKVGKLSRDERSLIAGCIGHADDEGRLQGDPPYLKATIFKYDDDLTTALVQQLRDSCLEKMKSWPSNHPYRMVLYINSDEEYLFFPNWAATNRPSHPTKSQLPAPPPETLPIFSGKSQENDTKTSRETPEKGARASALGQVRSGQVSIGQVRVVQEDFAKFLHSEKDLTDFLTTTLTEYMSAGRQRARQDPEGSTPEKERAVAARWGMPVIEKFWTQATGGKLSGTVCEGAYAALQKYPAEIVARAFVKARPYGGGRHKTWNYIQTIIEEEMEKHGRGPPD